MMFSNISYIRNIITIMNNDKHFFYDGDTGFIFESNNSLNQLIDELKSAQAYNVTQTQKDYPRLKSELDTLKKYLEHKSEKLKKSTINLLEKKIKLSSLWLLLSHNCNLNCTYCFSNGGNYGREKISMTNEIARISVDEFFKKIDKNTKRITINLFGGEPLINKDVLIYIVNYINSKAQKNDLKVKYILTTNGTIIDDELIDLYKKNDIEINISIDGLKWIHDKNRPFKNCTGSYEIIKKNVNILTKNSIDLCARLTLTNENIETFSESVKSLWDIGFTYVYYEPVSTNEEDIRIKEDYLKVFANELEIICKLTLENVKENKRGMLLNVLKKYKLLTKKRNFPMMCFYNNNNTLFVNSMGEYYKCDKFIESKLTCIGNVYDTLNERKFIDSINNIVLYEECDDCWAKKLCTKLCPINQSRNELECIMEKTLLKEALNFYLEMQEK